MTNGDKYLKDGVDVEEFIITLSKSKSKLAFGFGGKDAMLIRDFKEWLNSEAKPTLTEDEKVILIATSFGNQKIILRDSCGNLWTRDN